jgi:pumilio family protein 6
MIADGSKKDMAVRRSELLEFVAEDFFAVVEDQVAELMVDPLTIQVVQEIILYAKGIFRFFSSNITGKKVGAMQAITDLAARHPSNKDHIIKLPFTARVYKTLVQGGHYNPVEKKIEGPIHFSIPLPTFDLTSSC